MFVENKIGEDVNEDGIDEAGMNSAQLYFRYHRRVEFYAGLHKNSLQLRVRPTSL